MSTPSASPGPNSTPTPETEDVRTRGRSDPDVPDTPRAQALDHLVALAARMFRVPMALVSRVDRDREWLEAQIGLEAREAERCVSFCAHDLPGAGVLVVEDATTDPRLATSPLVVGPPHVRFYAGAPLITASGERVGTFCIVDHHPRTLHEAERGSLASFAATTMEMLESRRLARDLSTRLERESDHLTEFARAAAHDLRAPLRHVRAFGDLLARKVADRLGESEHELLAHISSAIRRMDARLSRLHEYALAASETTPERVDVREVVCEVLEDLRDALRDRDANVEIDDLPGVDFDRTQLRRLLQNLIENALAYGGPAPRIAVRAERETGAWRIEVQDSGDGVPAHLREDVFKPFRRATTDAEIEGSGMGLAICRRIVQRAGGRIWFADDPPPGPTTVCFTLCDPRPTAD